MGLRFNIRMGAMLAVVCAAFCAAGDGQTLAHRNWAGSGLVVEPWWRGAELYAIDPISFQDSNGDGFGDLNGITQRLDYLAGLGVDGIVLSPMPLQPSGAAFDKEYGTEEDFGRLVEEATRRKMRVLVDLPVSANRTAAETLGAARFWLTRGVAGLHLVGDRDGGSLNAGQRAERVRELRRLCAGFAGQRVLMGEDTAGVELIEQRGLETASFSAGAMRAGVMGVERAVGAASTPVVRTDGEDRARSVKRLGDGVQDVAIAKALAALLLGTRGAPMLYFGQELGMDGASPAPMQWGGEQGFTSGVPWIEMGPNAQTANVATEDRDKESLLNWYRRLGVLRRENAALREGTEEMLRTEDGDVVAWVRHARLGEGETPDVVVVVNCSGRTVSAALAGTRVLRTLAATFAADAAVSTRGIALPPFGVYVGEVQRKAGLETAPEPVRRRR